MRRIIFALMFLAIGLSACSLASDITPPPNYVPPATSAAPTDAPVVFPIVPPDPSQGEAIFAEKCLPCHGTTGMGDGPQAAQLPNPPTAIGSEQIASQVKPVDWYNVITNGRMDKFMPPWKNALTDRQRWDVLAYVFSLSDTPALVQQGKAIFDQKCTDCHGPTGKGDGPKAASLTTRMLDWSDLSRLAVRSANDLFQVISSGSTPDMPSFSSEFSSAQRWALTAYIRSLSFAGSAGNSASAASTAVAPAATAESGAPAAAAGTPTAAGTPNGQTINITGKITNTSGKTLPADLIVTLQGFDSSMAQVASQTAPVAADGSYVFKGIQIVSGGVYVASVEFEKIPFSSQPLHDTDIIAGKDADLPITVTAASSDYSAVRAQRLHIFFDFTVDGVMQVAELFIVQNPTDKALVPADPANPGLKFDLPDSATNLQFQDGTIGDGRYVKTEKGFGDGQSLAPQGTSQVLFAYEVPYTNQASISIPVTLPVDSAIVMVPSGGVNVQGSQVVSSGTRTVNGSDIAMFTASNLAAGSKLDLTISGKPSTSTSATGGTTSPDSGNNSTTALIIGLGVFGVVLVAGGGWMLRQRRAAAAEAGPGMQTAEETESAESILDAIVALDDLYQAGSLSEAAYKERRTELKDRLRILRS